MYILGFEKGNNYLNPYRVICQVKNCGKLATMKGMNNLDALVKHWEIHTDPLKIRLFDKACEVAVHRYRFIMGKDNNAWHDPTSTP